MTTITQCASEGIGIYISHVSYLYVSVMVSFKLHYASCARFLFKQQQKRVSVMQRIFFFFFFRVFNITAISTRIIYSVMRVYKAQIQLLQRER